MGERAGGDVTDRAADGDGGIKPRQHLAPDRERIQIRNERRRDRPVRRLAHADQASRGEQRAIGVGQTRRPAGKAPDSDADADEHPSRITIRQPAEDRRQQHVRHEECQDQPSDGRAAHAELHSDRFLDGIEDGTVDVIEKIDAQEKRE